MDGELTFQLQNRKKDMRRLITRRRLSTSFGSKEYWKAFYSNRDKGSTFEWYLDAEESANLIRNRIPRGASRLLELGCGTSAMGRKLRDEYDVVLTDNVDISDDVIFADMLNLPAFFTDRFDVVMDKGAFDAISFRGLEDLQIAFREALRVLKAESEISAIISISGEDPEYRMDRISEVMREHDYGTTFEELSAGDQGYYYLYRHIKR